MAYPGEKTHLRVNPIQPASSNNGPCRGGKASSRMHEAEFEVDGWQGVGWMCVQGEGRAHKEGSNIGLSGIKTLESTA